MTSTVQRPWQRFYPEKISQHLNYPVNTLPDILEQVAAEYPHHTAFVFAGISTTYQEFHEQVQRLAGAFLNIGIKQGDRVAFIMPNCPQYILSYYAVLRVGASVVQINPRLAGREILDLLADSRATSAVTTDGLYEKLGLSLVATSVLTVVVGLEKGPRYLGRNTYSFEDLLAQGAESPPRVRVNPVEDIAVLQYTSGTTGRPKGVLLTHFNLVANAYAGKIWIHDYKMGSERSLAVLPLYHSFGMTTVMNTVVMMAGCIIPVVRFSPQEVLLLIEKYRPTMFHGVPAMYMAMLAQPNLGEYDLSSIRTCICGGAVMPVEIKRRFETVTKSTIMEGYGLSEASPTVTCNPLGGLSKPGSVGIPYPDTECKIVDAESGLVECEPGQVGELIVRGPQVMKGYWNLPEKQQKALRNGWLYTGDLASMDEDGYFYLHGRKKQ